jgi:hypothetical protein
MRRPDEPFHLGFKFFKTFGMVADVLQVFSNSKINQINIAVFIKQDIFGLHIPMNHAITMSQC